MIYGLIYIVNAVLIRHLESDLFFYTHVKVKPILKQICYLDIFMYICMQ